MTHALDKTNTAAARSDRNAHFAPQLERRRSHTSGGQRPTQCSGSAHNSPKSKLRDGQGVPIEISEPSDASR
jgi:hypothetical protein